MALPEDVLALAEFAPVEDVMQALLKARLSPSIPVYTMLPNGNLIFPFVIPRSSPSLMHWRGDDRGFLDHTYLKVDVFTAGIDGDADGSLLAEIVRVVIRDAWLNQTLITTPQGAVYISDAKMLTRPRRESDWATATGPVQYADLPSDAHRYETTYRLQLRYGR